MRPGIGGEVVGGDERREAAEEVPAIVIGREDGAPLDAAINGPNIRYIPNFSRS